MAVFIKKFIQYPRNVFYLVLALAVLLRLVFLTTAYYGVSGELYRDMNVVWGMFHSNTWPLLGPSSMLGGFYFGAIYYYFMAPLVWLFGFAPYGATFLSSVFSILSLFILYELIKRWFNNEWLAVLACAIQAICLFDLQNSYYVSNPNILPFFVLSFFYLITAIDEDAAKIKNYILLGLVMGIATQLHATALLLLPLVLLLVFYYRKIRFNFKQAIVFALSFLVVNITYLIYVYKNGFGIFSTLINIGSHQASSGGRGAMALGVMNFLGSVFIFKDGSFNFYPGFAQWFILACALAVLVIVPIIWAFRTGGLRLIFSKISPIGKLSILLWFLCGLFMYLVFAPPPAYYYFIVMWPLPVILFTTILYKIFSENKKLFVFILSMYVLLQAVCLGVFFNFIYQPELSHKVLVEIFNEIKADSNNKNYGIANEFLDTNQFLYYLTYTGISIRNIQDKNYTIYYIKSCQVLKGQIIKNTQGLCLSKEEKKRQ